MTKMNKDKQIEEMAMLVCRHTNTKMCADGTCPMTWECPLNIKTVEALYNAGYRKASEVAREIFEEIEGKMNAVYQSVQYGCYSYMRYGSIGTDSPDAQRQMGKLEGVKHLGDAIAELKNKYIGEDTNVLTNTEDGE